MNLILATLRDRYLIALGTLLAVLLITIGATAMMSKTYKATATVVLNYKGTDSLTGISTPPLLMPAYMATQLDIIGSKSVALKVVDELGMAESAQLKEEYQAISQSRDSVREWLATQLLKRLQVAPSRESSVISITFSDPDPATAAKTANEFVTQYQDATVRIKNDPLKNVANYLNTQVETLRQRLESSQQKLSDYQREKGIISTDVRFDIETARVNELSSQLSVVQGQLADAHSKRTMAAGTLAADSPEVINNSLVQTLKATLAQAEARFSKVKTLYLPTHPQYQDAKAEVDQLRAALKDNIGATSNSLGAQVKSLQQREESLRVLLETQKSRLLQMNQARAEMSVLLREVENAQRAYDAALQRLDQTKIEGNGKHSDVSLLQEALVPTKPSRPLWGLNLALGTFLGTLLGIGAALVTELLDRRIRSNQDMAAIFGAPVLAGFNLIPQDRYALPRQTREHVPQISK